VDKTEAEILKSELQKVKKELKEANKKISRLELILNLEGIQHNELEQKYLAQQERLDRMDSGNIAQTKLNLKERGITGISTQDEIDTLELQEAVLFGNLIEEDGHTYAEALVIASTKTGLSVKTLRNRYPKNYKKEIEKKSYLEHWRDAKIELYGFD
jgi:hypothetical protein